MITKCFAKESSIFKNFNSSFLSKSQSRLVTYEKVIKSIDPQNVLDRGYSLITNMKGDVIKDSAQINEGEE